MESSLMSRTVIVALLLFAAPALAQERAWSELVGPSQATGVKLSALTTFVSGIGINRVANFTRLSCTSKLEGSPAVRVWDCGDLQMARCADEAQYDSLAGSGRLVQPIGIMGDAQRPPPAWFQSTGCASTEWVVIARVNQRRVAGIDMLNMAAFLVEAWGIDAEKARGFVVERDVATGTAYITTKGVRLGTRAEFRAAWKANKPQEQYIVGVAPDLVD